MQDSVNATAKDNGDWLSAQQAVRPDGTEVTNLPLVNKKLPPLVRPDEVQAAPNSPKVGQGE